MQRRRLYCTAGSPGQVAPQPSSIAALLLQLLIWPCLLQEQRGCAYKVTCKLPRCCGAASAALCAFKLLLRC